MLQLPGFEKGEPGLLCKLQKALYGLNQVPRAWFNRLKCALMRLSFSARRCDPSLFMLLTPTCSILVLVYVDDIFIIGSYTTFNKNLSPNSTWNFLSRILDKWTVFLGIEVTHLSNGSLMLSQGKYIRDLLLKTNMASTKGIISPMDYSTKLSKVGSTQVFDPT